MPRYGLVLQTAATSDPVTIDEALAQCRLGDLRIHDQELIRYIKAATKNRQDASGRQCVNATWDLYLDEFPVGLTPIYCPRAPLSSVTSITYTDTAGASQTWSSANYIVSTSREPGMISTAYGVVYPSTYPVRDAVRVRFVAGYGSTAASTPEDLKSAILIYIEYLFVRASNPAYAKDLIEASDRLLDAYRLGDEFLCYGREDYATSST